MCEDVLDLPGNNQLVRDVSEVPKRQFVFQHIFDLRSPHFSNNQFRDGVPVMPVSEGPARPLLVRKRAIPFEVDDDRIPYHPPRYQRHYTETDCDP